MKKTTFKFKYVDQIFTDPLQMIDTLFCWQSQDYYKTFVKEVLLHTHLPIAYYDGSTANMMFYLKNIKQFIKVGYAIKMLDLKSQFSISDDDIFKKRYFSNKKDLNKIWEWGPVALTADEYKDPYLVFKTVFETEDFKQLYGRFKDAFDAGCSTIPNTEQYINQLELYFKIYKIIEACYLINVREVFHHDGRLK